MADLSYGAACGGYTYVLEYEEGPLINKADLSVYTILPSAPGSMSVTAMLD